MSRNARFGDVAMPLATIAVLILAWDYAVRFWEVPGYLVPLPGAVLAALKRGLVDGALWPDIGMSAMELYSGYVIGCVVAMLAAVLVSEFRQVERAIYPVVVALQSIPKVALAPLIVVWFGFEMQSKVIMVALICFFPTFVSTVVGLKSYNVNLADMYRAFSASGRQIFFSVKLPSAASSMFAGLEISMVLALHGVVVAEFIASRNGLGHAIESSRVNFDVAFMFACVVVLSAIGVLNNQLLKFVHRRAVFWDRTAKSAH